MKPTHTFGMLSLILALLMILTAPPAATAAGTLAGTPISNTATINYQVGGVPQTGIESSPTGNSTPGAAAGTPTTFLVDNRIDLIVTETSGTYTDVIPNAQKQVLTFTVRNDGNRTQDFAVSALPSPSDPFGGSDNFDANNIQLFVDVNANGVFDLGVDTATHIDELAPDVSVAVFIVADIPAIQASGDIAAYTLTVKAHDAGVPGVLGGAAVQTAGPDTPGIIDVVFADAGGVTDGLRDASYSASDAFRVLSAQLTIQKTAAVIRDPFNLDSNPKNIPGAYIRYTITVNNAATATESAVLTTIVDTLDANTAIDPDLIDATSGAPENVAGKGFRVDLVGTSRANQGVSQYFSTTATVDGVDHDGSPLGGTVTATMSSVLPLEGTYAAGELLPGESVVITFNAVIQ